MYRRRIAMPLMAFVAGAMMLLAGESSAFASDLPDLSNKQLTSREVQAIVKNGKPIVLGGHTETVSTGRYQSQFREGKNTMDRYVLFMSTQGGNLPAGGLKTMVDSTYTCKTTERSAGKQTMVCYNTAEVIAWSRWDVVVDGTTWTCEVLTSRLLFDFTTGEMSSPTKAVVADEARDAVALRNRMKAKALG